MPASRIRTAGALALTGVLTLSSCAQDWPGPPNGGSTVAVEDCFTGELRAEGSSAQKNAIAEAIKSYQRSCPDATIDYAASGSGAGIKQFIAGQVDFGGSDAALKTTERDGVIEAEQAREACGSDAWNLPMVTGPVAVAYNLEGVDQLVLDAEVTAQIFDGRITAWNDPAIAALNPDVQLPATPINVYFRSDDSGTTENFTRYLAAAAPDAWPHEPGKKWTGKGEGKPQNAGVATATKGQNGSIAYLEWSYVTQNDLSMAAIDTGSGTPVTLTGESAGKAVETAEQVGQGNDLSLKIDYATKEPGAYPIVLVTYEIVCSEYPDPEKGAKVRSFLRHFASPEVQKSLETKGYAPLPAEMLEKVAASVEAIS